MGKPNFSEDFKRDAVHQIAVRGYEPPLVCRRLQLMSRMEHHEQNNEQVFPRSARTCRTDGFGHPKLAL